MRHGWKTRIDERRYFENKRSEREERQQVLALIREKMRHEYETEMARYEKERGVH
jgi:hypothetical protein